MKVRIGLGERWAIVAAVSYTLVNVTLRAAAPKVDPFVGSMLRQVPVAALAWGVVIAMGRRELRPRDPEFIGWRFFGALVAGGFVSFLIGNVLFFQALANGGLGISANAVQGGSVFAGIALAAVLLHEPPRREQLIGAAVIAVGLAFIAAAQVGTPGDTWYLGILFALGAGGCYAISNVMTRLVQRRRPILFVTLAGTSLGGLGSLAVAVLWRAGFDVGHAFGSVTLETAVAVLLAGCANAAALIGLTQSMKYSDVATTNTISSSQIVFSFIASVLLFSESGTLPMIAGVTFVIVGIVVAQIDRAKRRATREAAAAAAAVGDMAPIAPVGPVAAAPTPGDGQRP